jgi:hypothetical protein
VHRGPEVMNGITRMLLVHNIFWRLVYAKSTTGEIGEYDYKVSELGCGGLVVNDGARHLGVGCRTDSEAVMCTVGQGSLYRLGSGVFHRTLVDGTTQVSATGTRPMDGADRLGTDYQKMSAGHCVGLSGEMDLATDRKDLGGVET